MKPCPKSIKGKCKMNKDGYCLVYKVKVKDINYRCDR